MPTILSHAVAAIALKTAFPEPAVPRKLFVAGAVCSMLPDLDVIGFALNVPYDHFLGHRGFTHSLVFAALVAAIASVAVLSRRIPGINPKLVFLYLFLATASHGLLDALTSGGLGIAFFAPFNNDRYFFPVHPIRVSPIGVHFFSSRGVVVFLSELKWIWLPSFLFAAATIAIRLSAKKQNSKAVNG
jgi:inner membrane protein